MFSKKMLTFAISVLGIVFAVAIFIGLSGNIAIAGDPPEFPDLCGNNDEFTTEFRLRDCRYFKTIGKNPYFKLIPGYQLILEGIEEDDAGEEVGVREEVTVLCDTKWINLDGRWIKTRVVEERALEWDEDEGEEGGYVTIEISRNWFAICSKTNDVYYFGEFSRDCEDGFDENDVCEGGADTTGSWKAGVDGARPGIIMPGTFLLGAKYFQEIAPPDAVDRAEHLEMRVDVDVPAGMWSGCVTVIDTNPAEGDCGDDDAKTYCPGVGIVQDAILDLVSYGYVGCDDDDDHDHDDDDDDDDDDHDKRNKWRKKWSRR